MKKARNIVQIKQEGLSFKCNLSEEDAELVKADIALTKTINELAKLGADIIARQVDEEIVGLFGVPEEKSECQKPRSVIDPNPGS